MLLMNERFEDGHSGSGRDIPLVDALRKTRIVFRESLRHFDKTTKVLYDWETREISVSVEGQVNNLQKLT
jgi:hypothetical protein